MLRTRLVPFLGALALSVASNLLCSHGGGAAELTVAVAAPISGHKAAVGLSMHAAATLIASDLSKSGVGPALRLQLVDDTCAAEASLRLAGDIAVGPAVAVIGHACPAAARAAAPIYAKSRKVFLASGAVSIPSAVRLTAEGSDQGVAIARWLAGQGKQDTTIAIIRDKTQLNRTLGATIEAALKTRGLEATTEMITGGDKDFTVLAQRLQARGVTHVALLAFPIEAALLAADLVAVLPDVGIIGPDHLAQPDFASLAAAAAHRVRVVLPATVARLEERLPAVRDFTMRLRATGTPPTLEALETAAALQALAAAADNGETISAPSLREALLTPRATLLGPLAVDAAGNGTLPYWLVYRWQDGSLVQAL